MKRLVLGLLMVALLLSSTACSTLKDLLEVSHNTTQPTGNEEPDVHVDIATDESQGTVQEKRIGTPAEVYETADGLAETEAELYLGVPAAMPYEDGGMQWVPQLPSGETYLEIEEQQEKQVAQEPLTTFSLKVDTASYSNVQRYLEDGQLPPTDAVRIEELVNYFSYDEQLVFEEGNPFAVYTEIGPSPISNGRYLAFTRVATRAVDDSDLPPVNLTFLIDTSGSMYDYDKLPLLKEAFAMLVETLDEQDRVSIVTYAGTSEVLLDSANGSETQKILDAIYALEAGGSTAGAEGIRTAYELAEKNYLKDGNNRVILASDGDFNVGISSVDELEKLITKKRDTGLYLSVLGFGTGNTRDDVMETLAKSGNGNYSYINSISTARKVLVEEMAATLFVVADDVKAQIEFNPTNVKSYRVIGYENRMMANEDFSDDTKDAGEIGLGTDVVVLYELELWQDAAQMLKYQQAPTADPQATDAPLADELYEVRLRYKDPGQAESKLLLYPVTFDRMLAENSSDFRFAGAVAAFGHLLRDSEYADSIELEDVMEAAGKAHGIDAKGYRAAFSDLMRAYRSIVRNTGR